MAESAGPGSLTAPTGDEARIDPAVDAALADWRARGVQGVDPVRLRYIEALARRAAAQRGDVRRLLNHKLLEALAAYREQVETAQAEADRALPGLARRFPGAAADLRRLHAGADFRGLHRLAARLEAQARPGPLAELLRDIDRHAAAPGGGSATHAATAPAGALAELNALRRFRSTWARLSAERQLSRFRARVPENPGPLNSHQLVQRSLQLMQDISPAYLGRFMSHVEALLWLDQASIGAAPAAGQSVARDGDKKRKVGRGKGG